jgi:hypothetical protein
MLSNSVSAQQLIMVKDADGSIVGQALETYQSSNSVLILRNDGILYGLNLRTGNLGNQGQRTIYYESGDCSGQPYVSVTEGIFSQIVLLNTFTVPRPLMLIPAFQEGQIRNVNSRLTSNGCGAYQKEVETTPMETIDPTKYGFILTPDGHWGHSAPLAPQFIKVAQSEAIFCSGFENCPSQ